MLGILIDVVSSINLLPDLLQVDLYLFRTPRFRLSKLYNSLAQLLGLRVADQKKHIRSTHGLPLLFVCNLQSASAVPGLYDGENKDMSVGKGYYSSRKF